MKLLYYLFYAGWYLLSLLPFWLLYLISDGLYYLLYHVVRYRRRVVRKNLVNSFPEKSEAEIVRIEKEFYAFFCDCAVETIKQFSMSEAEMKRRMTFTGIDELQRDMRERGTNFAFIYLGHYCNWEWIASMAMAFDKDITSGQIYHPLYNKAFDRLFLDLRSRYGGVCIPMKETLRRIIEWKREKRNMVIGFISDQAPKWNSIHHFTPFLNQDTPVFIGTEKIGRQVNAVIYFADVTRPRRGYYECRLYRMVDDVNALKEFEVTDIYMQHLEAMIRRAPQYWLWSHNRWKRTRQEWERRMQAASH